MRKYFFLLIIFFVISIFLVSCSNTKIALEKQCNFDKDCSPTKCCHAKDALNKEYAPDCSGAICTMNCEPGTIDCNQGQIKCVEGSCEAIIK